jgi:transposase
LGARRAGTYYPQLGRPSIDPVLMIRMLILGYVFAIRSPAKSVTRFISRGADKYVNFELMTLAFCSSAY